MQSHKFIGWVEKLIDSDGYSREFVVRDYKDDNDPGKPQYPTTLTFRASVKNGSALQLDAIHEGDKVQVEFFITGKSGMSKAGKYYHINSLVIAKNNGVVVIEKAPVQTPAQAAIADEDDTSSLPF